MRFECWGCGSVRIPYPDRELQRMGNKWKIHDWQLTMSTPIGVLWTLLSIMVAGTCSFTFLQPFWFIEPLTFDSFGMYSYCIAVSKGPIRSGSRGYTQTRADVMDKSKSHVCGIYGGSFHFSNLPSNSWQVSAIWWSILTLFRENKWQDRKENVFNTQRIIVEIRVALNFFPLFPLFFRCKLSRFKCFQTQISCYLTPIKWTILQLYKRLVELVTVKHRPIWPFRQPVCFMEGDAPFCVLVHYLQWLHCVFHNCPPRDFPCSLDMCRQWQVRQSCFN